MSKIRITDTTLRDAQQSLIATRMKTKDMLEIVDKLDKAGFEALEVWGGATYDSCIRYLNEDPFERLREIKKRVKNTKLQMLLRGQNLLGYRHYSDDIVDLFIKKSIENGIDIIRIFDALNDLRNIQQALESTKKYKAHAQVAMCYTTSPIHNIEYYVNLAKEIENNGADSICIKDMSGILLPYDAFELISELKKNVNIDIELHMHNTAGIASMSYLKAIEAGVDIVDTAISTFASGTSQIACESLVKSLENTDNNAQINLSIIKEVTEYLKPLRKKYIDENLLNPIALFVEPQILEYQLPGGMLSNLLSQLKMQKKEDKYEEVLKEIPKVRKDLGYPPLVTPLSQMVGTQAVFNVITNERYKIIPNEIKDYVRGFYGKSPAIITDEIKSKIIDNEKIYQKRPADRLEPEYQKLKNEIGNLAKTDEDILTYALFPQIAKTFLENKYHKNARKEYNIDVIF